MASFTRSPADHLGAVRRSLRDGERDGLAVRVLVAERTYPAAPAEVWDALTTAERIPRWLSPVSGDLRLGGRYQIEGNAGGEILTCDEPHHLALTWEAQGQVSWVDVHLDGTDEGTTLRLEHAAGVALDLVAPAERIPRWLSPVSGDLRLGGRYQIEGNAGGEILTCDEPHHLALTWEAQGQVSWVDVHLDGTDEGTTLRLEHAAAVPPEFWDAYGPGAVGVGWELMLLGLDQHLQDPGFDAAEVLAALAAPQDHPEEMEWLGAITTGANDGWAQASTDYGTDPAQARAAADRTLAFYSGTETSQ